MDISKAILLLRKHRQGTLTDQERRSLERWYRSYALSRPRHIDQEEMEKRLDEVWNTLLETDDETAVPLRSNSRRWLLWAGAAASLLLMAGLYWWPPVLPTADPQTNTVADVLPGTARAYLLLSNGKQMDLSQEVSGILADENGVTVVKVQEGELSYQPAPEPTTGKPVYNEIITPRAGQYMVHLPDGTKVWLNAASSIRFPIEFSGGQRVVDIKGEAYFEVSKQFSNGKRIPFLVRSGQQTVEVLGTEFNVNSYSDEQAIRTTLVEGSIKVNFSGIRGKEVLLRPGQQLQYIPAAGKKITDEERLTVNTINTQAAIAWKNGYFRFDHVSLEELMRQICRWYQMDVWYDGPLGKHEFVGKIERTATLAEVLAILEAGDLSFQIDQNKIIVTRNNHGNL